MALKPYSELVKIDVLKDCDMRDAKDDKGNVIKVPYLNWAKCISLLREHGAEQVYYVPVKAPNGSFVFCHYEAVNKDGRKTGCYFVSVEIHIDDKVYTYDMPLMNGSLVVYEDTLNQLRIDNAHKRAFVKGVAIFTGLGFSLWSAEADTDKATDDLSIHDLSAIKKRIEQQLTSVMQKRGLTQKELCDLMGMKESIFTSTMSAAFNNIALLEEKLKKL